MIDNNDFPVGEYPDLPRIPRVDCGKKDSHWAKPGEVVEWAVINLRGSDK
ncbi:hypothetical protein SEA_AEGEUS_79 [Mycobacterium phage Aegeus]|nr:hypothetical protein SEA_BAUDELAIRE_79 [Mycobacterium phage Baudelaire]WKW86571.1 hypothetical protein SEA_AEGEUS_79 [Mycobacterium phage Aegeus]